MKTLETIIGQKVWAVDTDEIYGGCDGCMFEECGMPKHMNCASVFRTDKRDVIFLPYGEEKEEEKTFTREEVIALCRSAHLYGEQGALNLHNGTFKEWIEEHL